MCIDVPPIIRRANLRFMLVVVTMSTVSLMIVLLKKTTGTTDNTRMVIEQRCHVIPFFEQLYTPRGHSSKDTRLRYLFEVDESSEKQGSMPGVDNINELTFFKPNLTLQQLDSMFKMFHQFSYALRKANVTFMLYGGTLLGALRHHTMIPWDDDIDVLVNGSQKEAMIHALQSQHDYAFYSPPLTQWTQKEAMVHTLEFEPEYTFYIPEWKFFKKTNPKFMHKPFSWPNIDIFFFDENKTHIWDQAPRYKKLSTFRKVDVFPLQFRPYQGSLQPVPCNSWRVLSRRYKPSMCSTHTYNHKTERNRTTKPFTVRCESLYRNFPFVFRETRHDYVIETVKVGNCVVYQTRTALPCL